jgi:hypothetical protein
LRGLDPYEIEALSAVKSTLGISGGKQKSKDILDMRKKTNQKGGQASYSTNPTSHTYSSVFTDQQVVDAFRYCEASHYSASAMASFFGSDGYMRDTSTADDMAALRDCLGNRLRPTQYSLAQTYTDVAQMPYPGPCTTARNTRRPCPSGTIPPPPFDPSALGASASNPIGYTLGGGASRKRKSRSPPVSAKKTSPNRMPSRKNTRKASRKASRKNTRKASRKNRSRK